jgi:acetyl-CoA acetyltransferase
MPEAFICDAIRTPFGRYGGALASVRTDDLAAIPIRALVERNLRVDWDAVDDVLYGCANQAGEDNRNVARMALLLAGLPDRVPGSTINRLCGSSLDAIAIAARAIKAGETSLMIAGGVESMSRAPFVLAKATEAYSRAAKVEDTDDRLALRQSADEGEVRHRLDARDGGERRRRVRRRAR